MYVTHTRYYRRTSHRNNDKIMKIQNGNPKNRGFGNQKDKEVKSQIAKMQLRIYVMYESSIT